MTTRHTSTERAQTQVCATRTTAGALALLLRLIWVVALTGAACLASLPLQAAPRLQMLAILPWHADTGLTPSLPSEANPQGPSALVRWRRTDWLLDTAGQRLVATTYGAAQPLPAGWWEDAVADGEALWLLSRLAWPSGRSGAPPLVGVVRWQPGQPLQRWQLPSAHTASALLPSPSGGPPWVEFMHRDAAPLATQRTARPTTRGRPASPTPTRPRLALVGAGSDRQIRLDEPIAAQFALPAPIRLIRDAGRLTGAVWWVWDDSQGTRWFSMVSALPELRRTASPPAGPVATHRAVCKGIGPWQQLRVAHAHQGRVRVVCPLPKGVVVMEVTP